MTFGIVTDHVSEATTRLIEAKVEDKEDGGDE